MADRHDQKHGPMSYQHASHLLNPLRKLILSPQKLVNRLELKETSRVLELGPGPGYFSLEVARSLPLGILVLVDIQPEMLDMVRERLDRKGITNVEYIKGDAVSLPLDSASFDTVFLVAVLGEVPDAAQCMREVFRVLRPEGLVSVTEQPGDPDSLPLAKIQELAGKAGFIFERHYGRGKNFTANFRKPGSVNYPALKGRSL